MAESVQHPPLTVAAEPLGDLRFRLGSAVAVFAMIVALFATVGNAAPTRIQSCSGSGNSYTCQYYNGTMPAYAGGSCCVAYYASYGYNYWVTDTMWRPVGNAASVYWYNSSGIQGYVANSSSNPFSSKGSYGYDAPYCENDTGASLSSVTCQVYNWLT